MQDSNVCIESCQWKHSTPQTLHVLLSTKSFFLFRKLKVKLELFQSHSLGTKAVWNRSYPILFKSHEEINAKPSIHSSVSLGASAAPQLTL